MTPSTTPGPGGLPLVWRELFPGGPGLYVPVDPDSLLDEMDDASFQASDEKMPYFGLLWPAGESLAAKVKEGPPLEGRKVLDLGCGLGPVGLTAASRGAQVTFLDWEERAIEIVRRSASEQSLEAEYAVCDWRAPPPLPAFDRILAADVLYEERNLPAVLPFLVEHLAPGGEAWLTDPGRRHAGSLVDRAGEAGLLLLEDAVLPPATHGREVRLFRFGRE